MNRDNSDYRYEVGQSAETSLDWVPKGATTIVPMVCELLQISSVLDVGCGVGDWLVAFQDRGVHDIFGVDIADMGDQLQIDRSHFSFIDLRFPFDLQRRFDLVVCLEVAEHLPAESAQTLAESISAHTDAVLFSAAVPGQGGINHVNEQWPSYWVDLFDREGFRAFDAIRPRIWNDQTIACWYKQNILIFARGEARDVLNGREAQREHTERRSMLDIAHPDLIAAISQVAIPADLAAGAGWNTNYTWPGSLKAEWDGLREERDGLREERDRLRDKTEALRGELDWLYERVNLLDSEIRRLQASKTFRYTRPLRVIWKALRRFKVRSEDQ